MSLPKQRSTSSCSCDNDASASATTTAVAAVSASGGVLEMIESNSSIRCKNIGDFYLEKEEEEVEDCDDEEEQVSLVPSRGGVGGGGRGRTNNTNTNKHIRKQRCLLLLRRHGNRLYFLYYSLIVGALILGVIVLLCFSKKKKNLGEAAIAEAADSSKSSCFPMPFDDFLALIDSQPQKDRCTNPLLWVPTQAQAQSQQQQQQQVHSSCFCPNPVRASMPNQAWWNASWQVAFQNNLQLAHEKRLQQQQQRLDVVLLGDSITEAWHGTEMAQPVEMFQGNALVYRQLFDSPDSPLQGLALGIAGDRCPQLLYRLQHGEIDELYPKLFWILIGTNDVLSDRCNVDQIVAGNIRIVQELLQQRPDATVVIQSLLPVGDSLTGTIRQGGAYLAANQMLECFASSASFDNTINIDNNNRRRKVQFVNVTQLFLTPQNTANTSLLPDGLHPNGVGAAIWGKAIVGKVRDMIDNNE